MLWIHLGITWWRSLSAISSQRWWVWYSFNSNVVMSVKSQWCGPSNGSILIWFWYVDFDMTLLWFWSTWVGVFTQTTCVFANNKACPVKATNKWGHYIHHSERAKFYNGSRTELCIFAVKSIFDPLTARGKQHPFSTQERMYLWKCKNFRERKYVDLRGTWTPNLRIHAECSDSEHAVTVIRCYSISI